MPYVALIGYQIYFSS